MATTLWQDGGGGLPKQSAQNPLGTQGRDPTVGNEPPLAHSVQPPHIRLSSTLFSGPSRDTSFICIGPGGVCLFFFCRETALSPTEVDFHHRNNGDMSTPKNEEESGDKKKGKQSPLQDLFFQVLNYTFGIE